jgi:hypothetical protein
MRAPCSFRNMLMVFNRGLMVAVSSVTNLEVDMSKPRLRLIHCSNSIRPGAKHREHGRSFRPLVINGRVPRESLWEAALELIDLSFSISHGSYLTFFKASTTILEAYNWTYPGETS